MGPLGALPQDCYLVVVAPSAPPQFTQHFPGRIYSLKPTTGHICGKPGEHGLRSSAILSFLSDFSPWQTSSSYQGIAAATDDIASKQFLNCRLMRGQLFPILGLQGGRTEENGASVILDSALQMSHGGTVYVIHGGDFTLKIPFKPDLSSTRT